MEVNHTRDPGRTILLVDDDGAFRARVRDALGRAYRLTEAASEEDFRRLYQPHAYALVILDMRLQTGREGLDLLREMYALDELQPAIMVSAYGDTETTIEAIESGALMFLHKAEFTPGLIARVVEAVMQQGRMKRRIAILERRLQSELAFELVGISPGIRDVVRKIREAANDPRSTAVVLGERGSGRTLAARLIHDRSPVRSEGPFVVVGSDVLQEEAVEMALFGSQPTRRVARKIGLIEQAYGGVLFLEELEGCPRAVFARILDAVRVKHLGVAPGDLPIPIDSQLVVASAAENADIAFTTTIREASPAGRHVAIYMPPLRERREDIPILVPYFAQDMRRRGLPFPRPVSRQVMDLFAAYHWAGNVRELKAVIEYAEIRAAGDGAEEVRPRHLPLSILEAREPRSGEPLHWDYRCCLARAEVELVEKALAAGTVRTKSDVAAVLGYNDRFTLSRRIRRSLQAYPQLEREFAGVAAFFSIGPER